MTLRRSRMGVTYEVLEVEDLGPAGEDKRNVKVHVAFSTKGEARMLTLIRTVDPDRLEELRR